MKPGFSCPPIVSQAELETFEQTFNIQPGAEFCPASDPLLPEEATNSATATHTLFSASQDDRDMILIDEEQPRASAPQVRGRPVEYRQLFSRLKGK